MDSEDFRKWSRRAADWGADYRGTMRDLPVRPHVEPGEIAALIAASAPEDPEPMEKIFADFERDIVPGMTHWQHPRFFAYFPPTPRRCRSSPSISSARWRRSACSGRPRRPPPNSRPGSSTGCARRSACRMAFRASSRIRPRRRRFPPCSPCASVRSNGRATGMGYPASRACASTPPTRSTPRSTARSGCPASARTISCACRPVGDGAP